MADFQIRQYLFDLTDIVLVPKFVNSYFEVHRNYFSEALTIPQVDRNDILTADAK